MKTRNKPTKSAHDETIALRLVTIFALKHRPQHTVHQALRLRSKSNSRVMSCDFYLQPSSDTPFATATFSENPLLVYRSAGMESWWRSLGRQRATTTTRGYMYFHGRAHVVRWRVVGLYSSTGVRVGTVHVLAGENGIWEWYLYGDFDFEICVLPYFMICKILRKKKKRQAKTKPKKKKEKKKKKGRSKNKQKQ